MSGSHNRSEPSAEKQQGGHPQGGWEIVFSFKIKEIPQRFSPLRKNNQKGKKERKKLSAQIVETK